MFIFLFTLILLYNPSVIYSQAPLLQGDSSLAKGIEGPEKLIGNFTAGKPPTTTIFNLTSGYKIEPVVWNLTAPSSITLDDDGNMYISKAGYPYVHVNLNFLL
ncbi:MAG: hypothetical protein MRJ93_03500 [Nitrososphaeraceae archaeon]|nr:hypothetical protein [Nitrososphaeraceae archaeon]